MTVPQNTWRVVNAIIRNGNRPGIIRQWFDGMKAWAEANSGPDAAALRIWLRMVRSRPFYNAVELAKLWPALKIELGMDVRLTAPPPALWFERELEFCHLPVLQNVDGTCTFWAVENLGLRHKYFIVEEIGRWQERPLSQEEFENVLYA